jgi:hypothetical protein
LHVCLLLVSLYWTCLIQFVLLRTNLFGLTLILFQYKHNCFSVFDWSMTLSLPKISRVFVPPFRHECHSFLYLWSLRGLQLWRVAANILNKQSRTADKGWSSSLGVGRGAKNSSP